ncbi:TPT-domain-containing protein [Basidiobolus meristosporus CBS 931.73]|uniref:TPT-domain-containing protein n=1 Tax=Basidiobolus meristosporus CBS 931.73 TaxID=1314790 RepID=A0A1Y1XY71_9FUNG|nr:TPT-domain-containing protein [Basidiobolus meristosporus CBS 931.73]|eukprot:ORX90426.1 TPT-domain-containing protein [Basidiobolus meristosporus CBS 931.73]
MSVAQVELPLHKATRTPALTGGRGLWDSPVAWLIMYFFFNLGLTLYNKAVMQLFDFGFPWTLTGIHTLCGAIGSYLLYLFGVFKPRKLGERENTIMLAFSVLYTLNIAISNVSLHLVTVPFHQVVRAMTPLFTIILSVACLKASYSKMTYISLLPVIFGVGFATFGDYYFTAMGFFLTVLGTVLAAVKTVVTNKVQTSGLKLHPLDLLYRMSPLAFMQTVMYAYMTGELEAVAVFARTEMSWTLVIALVVNGVIAFFLNVVSFTANKKTSALTMTVAGNVKQVLSIVLAVTIFNLDISAMNGIGIALTLLGGVWYTYIEYKEKESKAKLKSQMANEQQQRLISVQTEKV